MGKTSKSNPIRKQLRITCFGAPTIQYEDELLVTLTGKAQALFLYLAVTGRSHTRDLLANLFWSECNNQQARNNLRYLLPKLRKLVGDYLVITAQTVSFNPQPSYWLDAEILRTTLATAAEEFDPQAAQQALNLYQGPFLAGFTVRTAPVFEEWVTQQRTEYHLLAVQGFYRLAEHYWRQAATNAGLTATQRLLQIEPHHEAGFRLQMRLLVQSGQPHLALEQYQQLQQLLQEKFQLSPETETRQLYEQIRNNEFSAPLPNPLSVSAPSTPPPNDALTSLDEKIVEEDTASLKHNLPGELTPFIGRSVEVATIKNTLLTPSQRLITLVGEGGIGKTRLALAVAQQVQEAFPDGVWFAPLAGLASAENLPDRLAGAIAEAMHLTLGGQSSLAEQLFRYLRTKQSLLILDSFEHLLDAADFILELLRHTNALKILITSRHILNFQAEYSWRVEGLSVPVGDELETISPELLLRYESVALFVERAQRMVRGFTLTDDNQREVAWICQFVGGLPLGAELAAALTRHYTCAEIVEALNQNYTILATAQRDMPPRHRSIQATLAYSWSFLTAQEARIAAACSIFRGGFTIQAAEEIMGANRVLLNSLEDHSLLRLVRQNGSGHRYEMHELVRQYAAIHLQTLPQLAQEVRSKFCTYYIAFIHNREEALVHSRQAQIELHYELNNLRQTWQWLVERADSQGLAQSSDGFYRFYYFKGMFHEGEAIAQAAASALRGLLATQPQAAPLVEYELVRALLTQGRFCERLARLVEAEQLLQEGVQRAKALGAIDLEVRACLGLAAVAQIRHDNATMRMMGEKMITLTATRSFPAVESARMKSYGLKYLGIYGVYTYNYQQAAACFNQGLLLARQIEDRELEAMLVNNLGVVYNMAGNFSQALRCFQQAFTISESLGERNSAGLTLINLAETYHLLGDWEEAKLHVGQALTLYHEEGYQLYEAKAWARLGRIAHAAGNDTMAHSYLNQALQIADSAGLDTVQAEFLTDLGHILLNMQQLAEADQVYRQALAGWQQVGARQPAWRVQAGLAQIALLQNRFATALAHVEAILTNMEGAPINALYDPITVYWLCYQTLAANHDRAALAVLQRGYALLQQLAGQIDDPRLHRSFFESNPVNRILLLTAQRLGATTKPASSQSLTGDRPPSHREPHKGMDGSGLA